MNSLAIITPSIQSSIAVITGLLITVALIRLGDQIHPRFLTIRTGRLSGLVQTKVIWLTIGTLLVIILLIGVGLVVGDYPIPASEALTTALWDRNGEYNFIINSLRFPRIVVAILAGMCFASSGLIFQSLINNPLVSPDIIGINSGAGVCAVIILAAGGNI